MMTRACLPLLLLAAGASLGAAQGTALRLKTVELEGPCFAFQGDAKSKAPYVILDAGTQQLFGAAVTIEIGKRDLQLTPEGGRKLRISSKRGKELELALGEQRELPIRVERVELGGHLRGKPTEGMAPVWLAYPHVASEARFGKKDTLICIDYDADGVLWEPGEDAVLYPGSNSAIPLREELIVGLARYRLRVGEKRGKRAIFAEKLEEMRGIDGNAQELGSVRILNRYRTGVGLFPSWLDPELSQACAEHCHYMKLNGTIDDVAISGVHTQNPSRPGYTKAGAEAGKYSCIWNTPDAEEGLRSFLTSLYHKAPLLFPHTPKVGIACRDDASLYDGHRGRKGEFNDWPILVPGPGQTIDRLDFGIERPDPRPEGASGGGHAILMIFDFYKAPVSQVEASLTRRASRGRFEKVPVWSSDPTSPAHKARPSNDGCICVIPQKALKPRSVYRSRIAYVDKNTGKRHVYEWEFRTP